MRRLQWLVSPFVSLPLWLAPAPAGAQQENVLEAGTRSQLFIDQHLVQEAERIIFTPHPARKHPGNPIVRADRPWEGWYVTAFGGTVLFDDEERRFKMWYRCPGNREYFEHGGICHAVSADGVHWEMPEVGTCETRNGRPHNVVSSFFNPSVFKDTADADPARRFKMVCFD